MCPQTTINLRNPKTTRVAEIHNDKVIIVTKTTITKEHYDELIAARKIKN